MAKKKISAFTATTTWDPADLMPVVINVATTPASRKMTLANLFASIATPILVKSTEGINFDTAAGDDDDIPVVTLNVTDTPSIWWDESSDTFVVKSAICVGPADEVNVFADDVPRDTGYRHGFAVGRLNRIFSWENSALGTGNYLDGKITSAAGNTNIGSAHDSFACGNRNVVGRRQYPVASQGVDALHGIPATGDKAFVIVAVGEGDITGWFPNAQRDADTDWITTNYGAGVTCEEGIVYSSGYPSSGNPASLKWAMHPYMIVRNSASETGITQVKILAATYSGAGTKIYYDSATSTYATISYVYGSLGSGFAGTVGDNGTGHFVAGSLNSTWGQNSVAHGFNTRAWGYVSEAHGRNTQASGAYSVVFGYGLKVTGANSFGIGLAADTTVVSQANTLAIMGNGGKVGINNQAPDAPINVIAQTSDDGAIVQKWGYTAATNATGYHLRLNTEVSSGKVKWIFSQANNTTDYPACITIDRGKIGFNTTAPDKAHEINSATGDCLRLTYDDANGTAANCVDFAVSATGDLTITPSGGDVAIAGNFSLASANRPVVAADATVGTLITAMTNAGWIKNS